MKPNKLLFRFSVHHLFVLRNITGISEKAHGRLYFQRFCFFDAGYYIIPAGTGKSAD